MTQPSFPILEWDDYNIAERELEYRLQEDQFFPDSWLIEYQQVFPKAIPKHHSQSFKDWVKTNKQDEMREMIWEDSDFWDSEWEYLLQNLQEILDRMNPNGKWRVDGANMGWRHLSGWKYIDCALKYSGNTRCAVYSDARNFLQKILPNTDCTFKIHEKDGMLRILNYHHDAPCGETYICRPCSDEEFDS